MAMGSELQLLWSKVVVVFYMPSELTFVTGDNAIPRLVYCHTWANFGIIRASFCRRLIWLVFAFIRDSNAF